MGSILNPNRDNSFTSLAHRKDKYLFVDKTDFIYETNKRLNEDNRFMAVTRPRRFGKTVTAHMLSTYYSKSYEGQNIFDGLKITGQVKDQEYTSEKDKEKAEERATELRASYEKHLNKYDVIYIDMNSIRSLYIGYLNKTEKIQNVNDIVDYLEYSVIKELKEEERFSECLKKKKIENTGLLRLYQHYNII